MTLGLTNTVREEHFTITYDGPAVAGGRMSVQELAPALIALSRSIQAAQVVAEPLGAEPALDIRAMRDGSFAIDLIVHEGNLLQSALDLLAGRDATAAVNLAGLVGIVFGGFRLTKRLAKRRIRRREQLEAGMVRLTFDDDTTLVIPAQSLTLTADRAFREAARDVVAPVLSDGVDSVALTRDGEEPVEVTAEDVLGFVVPPAEEEDLLDDVRDAILRPVSVTFAENNKWRLSDGDITFWASVSDQTFLDRVQSGSEVFAKSDIIRARLRTRSFRDADGELHTEREIIQVLAHVPGPRDVPLPFTDEESDFIERDEP